MTAEILVESPAQDATSGQTKTIASIIVPAYNEEAGLAVILEKIHMAVDGVCEVLVVDDGSNDNTAEVAAGFPCRLVRHPRNLGKGEALRSGVRQAVGKYIIFIDADDTYPAEAIPLMYEALESCDIVYASRKAGRNNIPPLNRLGNFIFQHMICRIYGFEASDYSTGLYGIRKHHLEVMRVNSQGFAIEPEIAIKATRMKLQVGEIPVEYRPRVGQAKLGSLRAGFEHLTTILRLLFWQPPPVARHARRE